MHDITRAQTMKMNAALKRARVPVANAGKKIKYQGLPTKFYWVGIAGKEYDYQQQLESRLFWRRLVASQQGEVASEGSAGYPESSKKY